MSGYRRVLVIGAGAREHALCWRLAGEPDVERVFVAPGNPLMSDVADVHASVSPADDGQVVALARRARVDLVIVGPEAPLVAGLADRLAEAGIACFGPSAAAARLEGSKAFTREICAAAGVPMAGGRAFDAVAPALEFVEQVGAPLVVKADGLAGGKGVAVCESLAQAERHIRDSLERGRFGLAGRRVVIERRLEGREASVIALCDGETAVLLPAARDHKRLVDGDLGPNTGGMGAISPVAELDADALADIRASVHLPVLAELARRGAPLRGALYAGLMLTDDGPRLLEFNVRFGDPEAQAILPLLAAPLGPALASAALDRLAGTTFPVAPGAAVALTLAAAGYPDEPRTGDLIAGIDDVRAAGALVFGAGVVRQGGGDLVTAGGRVLTVVGRGADVASAADTAYAAAERLRFPGMVLRHDIGRAARTPERATVGGAAA
jgi:phosphoribosylamine--glycine ligase